MASLSDCSSTSSTRAATCVVIVFVFGGGAGGGVQWQQHADDDDDEELLGEVEGALNVLLCVHTSHSTESEHSVAQHGTRWRRQLA